MRGIEEKAKDVAVRADWEEKILIEAERQIGDVTIVHVVVAIWPVVLDILDLFALGHRLHSNDSILLAHERVRMLFAAKRVA